MVSKYSFEQIVETPQVHANYKYDLKTEKIYRRLIKQIFVSIRNRFLNR